jgi:PAS domain S-box-containing protein
MRSKIVALFMVASLLPLALSAYLDWRRMRADLYQGRSQLLQARADQLADTLDHFNLGYLHSVERIARFPDTTEICGPRAEDPELIGEARQILEAYPASDPGIRGAGTIAATGRVILASEPGLMAADLSSQPAVRAALAGKTTISDVYIEAAAAGGVPSIAYLAPVFDAGHRVRCVAALWVRATALWASVKSVNALAGDGSFAVVFDAAGIRIAHTFSDDILFHPGGQLDPASAAALVAEQRFGPRTQVLIDDVRAFPEQFERARATTPDRAMFQGIAPVNQRSTVGVARRLTSVPWTVFYMVPEDGLEAALAASARQRLLLAGAIVLAAAVFGALFAASTVRRIRRLAAAAAAIAEGRLQTRVEPGGDDDLGALAHGFNTMAEQVESQAAALRSARDGLEQRVGERTAELQRTTTELAQEAAERRRTEAVLTAHQALLQAIADNATAVIFLKDLEGRYLFVNRRFTQLWRVEYAAVLGKTDYDFFSRGEADDYRRVDQRVAQSQQPLVLEEYALHPDGLMTFLSVKCPLRDAAGCCYGVLGIATDISERKQFEDTRLRLAAIVQSSGDAIVGKTLLGIITSWNPGAERLFGYSAAEAIGRPMQMLMPPDRIDEEARILERLARGESVEHFETVRQRKDGSLVDISTTISPVRDAIGRVVGASKIARDIGQRKQADARLHAQLQRLRLLDEITRAIGERQDLASIYQVAVRSLEEQLPADFSCVLSHDPDAAELTLAAVGVRSQALSAEIALPPATVLPVDGNGLSRCLGGELVCEEDTSTIPFPLAQRLAAAGLHSLVVAPLQSESRVFGVLLAARRERNAFSSSECEFIRQLSSHVALAAHQAQLHGALQGAFDELRQTQQAVMQQERLRALGQMASGIAHDINNAISPAVLYAESLLAREPLSDRARGYVQSIARAVDDVAATVARMREFYRGREPQLELLPVALNDMVRQVIDLSRARWSDMPQKRGVVIEVETSLAEGLPPVPGVESEIREALVNLVFNAVDAMPDGGRLSLRTRLLLPEADGEGGTGANSVRRVAVEVADTGLGMDEATRRRCLEPFFTTKGERGTGLGLAMVYGAVQRHGAGIEIESVPGAGSLVRMTFAVRTQAAVAPARSVGKLQDRLRILLVDDDPVLLRSLRDTLEGDGHIAQTAAGGQAGIDAFDAALRAGQPHDVVITDLGMPHVDGRSVAAAIKRLSPATPVMLLTGWGQRMSDAGTTPAEVDMVLSKPPRLADLRTGLAQCRQARQTP